MDRHDRMPGHAAQPPSRGLLDASAQARRPLPFPAALPNGHSLPPSAPGLRNISSSSILQASTCTTSSQAIALAREAMRHALENEQSQAAEAGAVRAGLRSGITVDLSRKNIQTLPEEVVDIVKDELERSVDSIRLSLSIPFSSLSRHCPRVCALTDLPSLITSCHLCPPDFLSVPPSGISTCEEIR